MADEISELFPLGMHNTHTHTHTHRIEEQYGREVRIISVDFSGGMDIYPNLAEQLQDLDIGVLSKQFFFQMWFQVNSCLVWLTHYLCTCVCVYVYSVCWHLLRLHQK